MLSLPSQAASLAPSDTAVRMLVVDDDPTMLEYARLYFGRPNVAVDGACDGRAGLDRMLDETFDIVLLDLHMPKIDGLGVLMEARRVQRLAATPIVIVTARSDVFAIDRAYELGATSFVTKPLQWELLVHQMRFVLRAAQCLARGQAEPAGRPKLREVGASDQVRAC